MWENILEYGPLWNVLCSDLSIFLKNEMMSWRIIRLLYYRWQGLNKWQKKGWELTCHQPHSLTPNQLTKLQLPIIDTLGALLIWKSQLLYVWLRKMLLCREEHQMHKVFTNLQPVRNKVVNEGDMGNKLGRFSKSKSGFIRKLTA